MSDIAKLAVFIKRYNAEVEKCMNTELALELANSEIEQLREQNDALVERIAVIEGVAPDSALAELNKQDEQS